MKRLTFNYAAASAIAILAALFAPAALAAPAPANLLTNGSFESPVVSTLEVCTFEYDDSGYEIGQECNLEPSDWDVYGNGEVPGWSVVWEPGSGSGTTPQIEIQENEYGVAADGSQYAELDSNYASEAQWAGPEESNSYIYQTIPTTSGATYELYYDSAPRPANPNPPDIMYVRINGSVVETDTATASSDGISWTEHMIPFTAASGQTTIGFAAGGVADTFGELVDNVRVYMNPSLALPNLSATAISNTSATLGTLYYPSATITNTSASGATGPVGSSFPVLFQQATDAAGDNATTLGTATVPPFNLDQTATAVSTTGVNFWTGISTWIRACANTLDNQTFSIEEVPLNSSSNSGYSDNCGNWTQITKTGPDYVGLAPNVVTTQPIITGTYPQFSGATQNDGTGAATTSTHGRWQIDAGAANTPYDENTVTVAGGFARSISLTVSGITQQESSLTSWVASVAGTYKARFCANTPNYIPDGDPTNNCGPDTQFIVSPPYCSFTWNPSTVAPGGSSGLQWNCYGFSSCTSPDFTTGGSVGSGSYSVPFPNITGTKTVTLTCTGSNNGTYQTCISDTNHSCTAPAPSATLSIAANPTHVDLGSQTVLTYHASNVASCKIMTSSGDSVQSSSDADGSGNWSAGSPLSVTLYAKTTYVLDCTDENGLEQKAQAVVNLNSGYLEY